MGKTNDKRLIKLIGIFLVINIILSIILTFTIGGNNSLIIRFVDNVFILGAGSLMLSIIFAIIRFIISYKDKKVLRNKPEAKKGRSPGSKAAEEKILLRRELFNMLYRAFSITGFICFVSTFIIAMFI